MKAVSRKMTSLIEADLLVLGHYPGFGVALGEGVSLRAAVRLLVALCCVIAGTAAARAEKRVALIVGNSSYAHIAGLPNVPNDAKAMGALFKAANFDAIDVLINLDGGQLRWALKAFAGRTADADVAVLYYAGHGIEVGQTNYLIPVDARLATDFDVEDETVPLDRVLQAMEPVKRLRLVILDACRENPFLKSMKRTVATRSVGRGLSRVEPTTANTLIAFATKPNAVAEDGTGPNSPFTAGLVKHLLTPGLDLRIALGKVRDEVMASTGGRQEPYVTSSLGGGIVSIVPGPQIAAPPTTAPRPGEAAEAWAAVKDTTSIAQLEVIATRYKGTVYANLASARIEELKKQRTVPTVPPAQGPEATVGAFSPSRAARPLTNAEERALKPKDSFRECKACPEMVVVPVGEFLMGTSPADIVGIPPDDSMNVAKKIIPNFDFSGFFTPEQPQHRVRIARPFAVGKFEVTFAEWDACVEGDGCASNRAPNDFGMGKGRRPVINVSWDDAKDYLAWLSQKTGKAYRLLTEAEWEYAARAGTTTNYAFGDKITKYQAQFSEGTPFSAGMTAEVGSFPANRFRLHDMHGNVEEWVEDCWSANYRDPPADGSARMTGECDRRVLRGGQWVTNAARYLRSASRNLQAAGFRSHFIGFRVARAL